jgi:nuclear export mediator factor NEMF
MNISRHFPCPHPPTNLQDLNLSLKEFIPSPKPNDIIADVITICAPWSALTRYKYKLKLTPGTTKKGKASRSAISAFLSSPVDDTDPEKMSSRGRELLLSLKGTNRSGGVNVDEELVQCIWPKTVKVIGGKNAEPAKGGKKSAAPAKGRGK